MIIVDIARNELRRFYHSPIAWIMLAFVQLILAIVFYYHLSLYLENQSLLTRIGITEFVNAGMLNNAGFLLVVISPFLTMRLFSEEQRSKTISLLFSSPVSITSLVLGKYLATVLFFTSMLIMIALLPLSLIVETKADTGLILSGMLGLSLLMLSHAAIGLFMSTLSRNPGIAAISTFVTLFIFWIIHLASNTDNDRIAEITNYLSMQRHYQNMVSGMFSSIDVVYYLLLCISFVLLSVWQLNKMRAYN